VVEKVVGGIQEHQGLEIFRACAPDVALKEQIDLMSRCWFSLTANRNEPIEHEYRDARSKRVERIRISGSQEYGIATIHDQDLLLFAISQWVEAKSKGLPVTRRVNFTPYQFFGWINRTPTGSAYQRLQDALHRLRTTTIETTVDYEGGKRHHRKKQFSWISEWAITEDEGRIRGIDVVLAEWLFESIQNFHVLTLDKRYFEIPGSVERWLYMYAHRATGGVTGQWKEGFKSLYQKSSSQQSYKHYASTLRKLIEKNDLPGLRLEKHKSASKQDMLFMERTDKREPIVAKGDAQLELIELSPLEEACENVFEILRKQIGEPTANSWLKPLHVVSFDNATITYRAPTKFIGDWVESHYVERLRAAWKSVGYEVAAIRMETRNQKSAA